MNPAPAPRALRWLLSFVGLIASIPVVALGAEAEKEVRILQLQGTVEVRPAGAQTWVLTQTNQILRPSDRLRTGRNSRAVIGWSDQSVVPVGPLTELEIQPPDRADSLSGLQVFQGVISFFHRERPGRIRILTRAAAAGVEGTEFVIEVLPSGERVERVVLSVVDGKVSFTNAQGGLVLSNSEQAIAEPGQRPMRTAGFIANNVLQWCFYYPAVLDLKDLALSAAEAEVLKSSLDAYRAGDLLRALQAFPANAPRLSERQRLYYAALLLAVGEVAQTERELNALGDHAETSRLANSLRTLIASVKRDVSSPIAHPELASELLAASYFEQSRAAGDASLTKALDLARRATIASPNFGFAWARVAELEFGFGRNEATAAALDQSLALSPRNAQALALRGFVAAGRNDIREAIQWFDQAIATDGALANAWLGRGLCRIRSGQRESGRNDLLVAAALEPQRSLLRSYLGKAFTDAGEVKLAERELELARRLDQNDPTVWLYSALLRQQQNRVNEAVRDLENSSDLNDNRALFRSRMLLDQDRAVRSANRASVYRDAGMNEVALREAARAVTYDYTSDSAHLFISDSFDQLRDPTRFNLRYETVWFNELLLANLLSPVGAGRLSRNVSQQEYSKLFESDGLGVANDTLVRSDGQIIQRSSQFGTFGNTEWAFDVDYQHNNGVRPNNELDRLEWYTTVKQQLTPQDNVLVLVKYEDFESGDNFQYYNPRRSLRRHFRFDEQQEPIVVAGYQHEWSPGVRTLLLGGRLVTEQNFSDRQARQLLLIENEAGAVTLTDAQPFDVRLRDEFEIYTAELNQIFQRERFNIVAGGRWQGGDFRFSNSLKNSPLPPDFLPAVASSFSEPFERLTGYGYLTVQPLEKLWCIAGVSYDHITMPSNFREVPQSAGTEDRDLLGPKAGFVWEPIRQAALRGIYAKSLSGVSLDESYRLEPTQLAGFPQSFRTVISESIAGSIAGAESEVIGLALDLKPGHGTYGGVQFERVQSDVARSIGAFRLPNSTAPFVPSRTRETLEYEEQTVSLNVNQLLGDNVAIGANYRMTRAQLDTRLPELPSGLAGSRRDEEAWLHQVGGYFLVNHSSGVFARFDTRWYQQSNQGYTPDQPGDEFMQLDVQAGYRFFRRQAQVTLGILNLTDQDYRLNPLTLYAELPRERVFFARVQFRF